MNIQTILRGVAYRLSVYADRIDPPARHPSGEEALTPREQTHRAWLRARGDSTLRVDYALAPEDVVLDVGGFEGQWASDIFGRYLCRIHVFEPIPEFADFIEQRFARNPAIRLHRVALGAQDHVLQFTVDGDASSAHAGSGQVVQVPVKGFSGWMETAGLQDIALMKINIEGGEYDLIEHMIATGLIGRVRDLQVQFHDFVPDAERRMAAIQEKLLATHQPQWQYPFVWESWTRREGGQ